MKTNNSSLHIHNTVDRTPQKLPVCKRNLSFEKDGAQYYTPLSVTHCGKHYTADDMRDISLKILETYLEKNPVSPNSKINHAVEFTQDFITKNRGNDTHIGVFSHWIDDLQSHLLDKLSKDLNIDKNNIDVDIAIKYRTSISQQNLGGEFHEDGKDDINPLDVQMLYPLDNTEMGTLFVPYDHKQRFKEIHGFDKNRITTHVYNAKNKIGIIEQADPSKIFAMLRHTHEKGLIHAIPQDTNHSKNNIRRPLLTFEFY
jgi:hypothetical protein